MCHVTCHISHVTITCHISHVTITCHISHVTYHMLPSHVTLIGTRFNVTCRVRERERERESAVERERELSEWSVAITIAGKYIHIFSFCFFFFFASCSWRNNGELHYWPLLLFPLFLLPPPIRPSSQFASLLYLLIPLPASLASCLSPPAFCCFITTLYTGPWSRQWKVCCVKVINRRETVWKMQLNFEPNFSFVFGNHVCTVFRKVRNVSMRKDYSFLLWNMQFLFFSSFALGCFLITSSLR